MLKYGAYDINIFLKKQESGRNTSLFVFLT
jgi:hypothetical protein